MLDPTRNVEAEILETLTHVTRLIRETKDLPDDVKRDAEDQILTARIYVRELVREIKRLKSKAEEIVSTWNRVTGLTSLINAVETTKKYVDEMMRKK